MAKQTSGPFSMPRMPQRPLWRLLCAVAWAMGLTDPLLLSMEPVDCLRAHLKPLVTFGLREAVGVFTVAAFNDKFVKEAFEVKRKGYAFAQ